MSSREEIIEVEEIIEEINTSMNTSDYLAAVMENDADFRRGRRNYDYYRRGRLFNLFLFLLAIIFYVIII